MKYTNKRLGKIWYDIQNRCYNEKCQAYKNYGARGIKVCDEWRNSYSSFENWAYSNGYDNNLTIDRINVNLGYSPNNCRWVTKSQQCNNRANNIFIEYNGERHSIAEWARIMGMSTPAFWARVKSKFAEQSRIFNEKDNRKLKRNKRRA